MSASFASTAESSRGTVVHSICAPVSYWNGLFGGVVQVVGEVAPDASALWNRKSAGARWRPRALKYARKEMRAESEDLSFGETEIPVQMCRDARPVPLVQLLLADMRLQEAAAQMQ